jgi:hypothetical protein
MWNLIRLIDRCLNCQIATSLKFPTEAREDAHCEFFLVLLDKVFLSNRVSHCRHASIRTLCERSFALARNRESARHIVR